MLNNKLIWNEILPDFFCIYILSCYIVLRLLINIIEVNIVCTVCIPKNSFSMLFKGVHRCSFTSKQEFQHGFSIIAL